VEGDRIVWSSVPDIVDNVERVAAIEADGDGTRLTLSASYRFRLPYFRWLFAPFVHRSMRRSLAVMADAIEARATGRGSSPEPRRPMWAPHDRMSAGQAAAVATICAVLIVAGYGSSLFTQTVDFVARSFHATDANLGVALAVTRIGVLVGLVGSALADRRGRRRILLGAVAGISVSSALTALAPNLATFTTSQVFVRGFFQLATVVGYIAITEEAPEGSRAFLLAVAGMAIGAGFAIGAAMLSIAEISPGAWRVLFAVGGLGLLVLPGLAKRLPETARYSALSGRGAAARSRELVDQLYGARFYVVAAVGFLLGFFGSPSLQFTNRYLQDERHFSAFGITALRSVTQGLPALIAIVAGGRLAESKGRKPVAARATLVLALATVGFFLLGGPPLWAMMLVGTAAAAVSGPAMTSFNTELFPTEVRGRAGAALLATSVAGSIAGLLLVGYLSQPLGTIGRAVAVTCVAPIVVALFLVPRLPEARGRALDEVSPPEV
jgi:MFS family permease